jgi:hypothetical protein
LHWECRHWRSTCRYIHQAIGWEKVLQAKEWVEHIGFLKYVLMHPPLIWHASPSSYQGKSCLAWHTPFAKDMFSVSSHSLCLRLIPNNQMNLMLLWYHYCFYAWLDLVVAYDIFVASEQCLI